MATTLNKPNLSTMNTQAHVESWQRAAYYGINVGDTVRIIADVWVRPYGIFPGHYAARAGELRKVASIPTATTQYTNRSNRGRMFFFCLDRTDGTGERVRLFRDQIVPLAHK